MALMEQERRRHNEFERRSNAQGYIEALTEYGYGLMCNIYSSNATEQC